MASHFVSLNRGVEGSKFSDFTFGTSSTATDSIELRVLDGNGLSKMDVIKALEAFEHLFGNPQLVKLGAFDVSG